MRYTCEHCGRSFDTAIGCQEHEAGCEAGVTTVMVKFKFWFAIGPENINDNCNRRIERSELRLPREVADRCNPGRINRDFSGGIVSLTTICRPEDEETALGKFMYGVERIITDIMYAVRNARLAFIGSVDYIKDKGKKQEIDE